MAKNLAPLPQLIRGKTTTNYDLIAFSRAWRQLHVFASSSKWFIELSASVVIGQSYNFGFGFTTLCENRFKLIYIDRLSLTAELSEWQKAVDKLN